MILSKLVRFFSPRPAGSFKQLSAGRSHIGRVRKNNEDSLLILSDIGLYLVCDGMGGHSDGELASKLAVEIIYAEIQSGNGLNTGILAAHRAIQMLEGADEKGERKPGSTVVALKIDADSWQLCWVGDSRGWLLQKKAFQQLSVDHTVVQQMVNWGDISAEEALTHPDRNRLSQALGSRDKQPVVGCVEGKLHAYMSFLLATDGMALWNEPGNLQRLLLSHGPEAAVDRLIELSLEEGGHDNVTCIVVRIENA